MNDTAPNVIVIPAKVETPQEQEKKRHLRVAAYCRVSTDSEEQLSSYENQLSYYTEKIMKEPGWTMAGVFADEGITGTSTCKRKEFLRMIRQCRQGKIDMILAKSVSRFARNTVDTLNFTRELRSLGIPVIFEEQNINSIYPESEFLITLHGAFAQAESESTSSRVRWGKRQAMKSGHVAMQYKQLLGYEKGPDGKPRIVPEQAETVRFIYDRYLAGDSVREIKAALEGREIPTVSGKTEWMASHIRSILTNEKYCGDVLLQKTFIQDCISKKVIPNTGQLPKYLIQNHHEGIVSRETFDAVQLEMARRNAKAGATRKSTPTGRGKYSGKHVLSNLLFCGECGTAYRRCVWTQRGIKRPVWRCVSRLDYGKKFCTQSPTLDEEPLQQAILAAVNGFFRFMGWKDIAVKLLKIQKALFCDERRELTRAEYARLVSAAQKVGNERLSLVMQTICATGTRVSELRFITVEAVTTGRAEICNKGKRRTVFLPGRLRRLLRKYLQKQKKTAGAVFTTRTGRPLDRSNIWRDMKALCESADVEPGKVFPLNLRHLFARTYYSLEKDLSRMADILGHSSVNTTRIYTMESGGVHQRQLERMGLIIT